MTTRSAYLQRYTIHSKRSGKTEVRWRVFHFDARGRKLSKVFDTRREAQSFIDANAVDRATGRVGDSRAARQTLASLYAEVHAATDYAPATLELHRWLWREIEPRLGAVAIGEISAGDVEAVLSLVEKPVMREKCRGLVSSLYAYALAQGRVVANPAAKPRRRGTRSERMASRIHSARDETRYLTSGELEAIVAELPERYRAIVRLMATIGLRPGEAVALTVGKLDPMRRRIVIDTSASGFTKTGEPRTLTLPAVVVELLVAHLAEFSDPRDPAALMFPTREDTGLSVDELRHIFRRAARRAGVDGTITPNHLRHVAAAFAIDQGGNVYDVQLLLGHSKPSITLDVYGHRWPGAGERLAEKMDGAIRSAWG